MLLFRKKTRYYTGLSADWVFGDNFLQSYCVVFEYAMVNSRIGFARANGGQEILSNLIIELIIFASLFLCKYFVF